MRTITATIPAFITTNYLTPQKLMAMKPEEAAGCGSLAYYKQAMDGWTQVGTAEITIALLDDDAVVGHMVDSLKAQKQKLQADTQVAINRLDEKIQSLLALPAPARADADDEDTPDDAEIADALAGYESRNDDDLPQHKRAAYREQMYDAADSRRKAQREDLL